MKSFKDVTLPAGLQKALKTMRFTIPTPIQAKAIPSAMMRRDLIGNSETGSGKTLAFTIPLISLLIRQKDKLGLILTSSSEFADSIFSTTQQMLEFIPDLKVEKLTETEDFEAQAQALLGKPRILIATPTRLVEHIKKGSLSLSKVEILILDNTDEMIDAGLSPQMTEIIRFLPKTRQTLLFSNTYSAPIAKLAQKIMKDPIQVQVA